MKKKLLIVWIAVFSVFSTGCGLIQQTDDKLQCSLANNLYRNGDEVRLNYVDTVAVPAVNASDIAQSFIPSERMEIDYVDLLLQTVGSPNPAGTVTLSIQKDGGSQYPDNVNIASGFIQIAQLSSQIKTIRFAFAKVQLEAGKKYWLRLSTNVAANSANTIAWAGSSNNVYSQGEAKYLSGGVWSNAAVAGYFSGANQDLVFNFDCKNEK